MADNSARKTGLPEYSGDTTVYAGKITEITPMNIPGLLGCLKLKFGDLNKEANVLGSWASIASPQVGGYFVVYADGGVSHIMGDEFERRFVRTDHGSY